MATFRCRICNLELPADMKAPLWGKGEEQIDLGRCVDCARLAARWNTSLKADGQQVVATIAQRPRRRSRRR